MTGKDFAVYLDLLFKLKEECEFDAKLVIKNFFSFLVTVDDVKLFLTFQ